MSGTLRHLKPADIPAYYDLLRARPIHHAVPAARLELPRPDFFASTYSDLVGFFQDDELQSVLMTGANLTPIELTDASLSAFIPWLISYGRRCSSIVGPHNEVNELWHGVKSHWGPAREVRSNQLLMSIESNPSVQTDDRVRFAQTSDFEELFNACVDMFTEEVGVSPLDGGGRYSYRNRVNELVTTKRSFVLRDSDAIVFKAEVGAVGNGVAQIQGVWVHPECRGQGIATPAMASVVRLTREFVAPTVSLVVNDFNDAAIATYASVGFSHIDDFQTVLF